MVGDAYGVKYSLLWECDASRKKTFFSTETPKMPRLPGPLFPSVPADGFYGP